MGMEGEKKDEIYLFELGTSEDKIGTGDNMQ